MTNKIFKVFYVGFFFLLTSDNYVISYQEPFFCINYATTDLFTPYTSGNFEVNTYDCSIRCQGLNYYYFAITQDYKCFCFNKLDSSNYLPISNCKVNCNAINTQCLPSNNSLLLAQQTITIKPQEYLANMIVQKLNPAVANYVGAKEFPYQNNNTNYFRVPYIYPGDRLPWCSNNDNCVWTCYNKGYKYVYWRIYQADPTQSEIWCSNNLLRGTTGTEVSKGADLRYFFFMHDVDGISYVCEYNINDRLDYAPVCSEDYPSNYQPTFGTYTNNFDYINFTQTDYEQLNIVSSCGVNSVNDAFTCPQGQSCEISYESSWSLELGMRFMLEFKEDCLFAAATQQFEVSLKATFGSSNSITMPLSSSSGEAIACIRSKMCTMQVLGITTGNFVGSIYIYKSGKWVPFNLVNLLTQSNQIKFVQEKAFTKFFRGFTYTDC